MFSKLSNLIAAGPREGEGVDGTAERQLLLTHLKLSVSELQRDAGASTTPIENSNKHVHRVCSVLELILRHGLKSELFNSFPSFWPIAVTISRKDVVAYVRGLAVARTDHARVRAWIRLAFNEQSLGVYVGMLLEDAPLLRNSYDRHAFLLDQEAASILQTAIESLSFTMHFNLKVDDPSIEFEPTPLAVVPEEVLAQPAAAAIAVQPKRRKKRVDDKRDETGRSARQAVSIADAASHPGATPEAGSASVLPAKPSEHSAASSVATATAIAAAVPRSSDPVPIPDSGVGREALLLRGLSAASALTDQSTPQSLAPAFALGASLLSAIDLPSPGVSLVEPNVQSAALSGPDALGMSAPGSDGPHDGGQHNIPTTAAASRGALSVSVEKPADAVASPNVEPPIESSPIVHVVSTEAAPPEPLSSAELIHAADESRAVPASQLSLPSDTIAGAAAPSGPQALSASTEHSPLLAKTAAGAQDSALPSKPTLSPDAFADFTFTSAAAEREGSTSGHVSAKSPFVSSLSAAAVLSMASAETPSVPPRPVLISSPAPLPHTNKEMHTEAKEHASGQVSPREGHCPPGSAQPAAAQAADDESMPTRLPSVPSWQGGGRSLSASVRSQSLYFPAVQIAMANTLVAKQRTQLDQEDQLLPAPRYAVGVTPHASGDMSVASALGTFTLPATEFLSSSSRQSQNASRLSSVSSDPVTVTRQAGPTYSLAVDPSDTDTGDFEMIEDHFMDYVEKRNLREKESQQALSHFFAPKARDLNASQLCDVCAKPLKTLTVRAAEWVQCLGCGQSAHAACTRGPPTACPALRDQPRTLDLSLPAACGLDAQNFRCFECGTEIGFRHHIFSEARLCAYTGQYFCTKCHDGAALPIPAHIVHNWDLTPRPVCRRQFAVLSQLSSSLCIPLPERSRLVSHVEELREFILLRGQLSLMAVFITTCRYARGSMVATDLLNYNELSSSLFSVEVFVRIAENRGYLTDLARLREECRAHIKSCELCIGKGHICLFCGQGAILHPFDLDVASCAECSAVSHKRCAGVDRDCPRCARRSRGALGKQDAAL